MHADTSDFSKDAIRRGQCPQGTLALAVHERPHKFALPAIRSRDCSQSHIAGTNHAPVVQSACDDHYRRTLAEGVPLYCRPPASMPVQLMIELDGFFFGALSGVIHS